MTGKQVVVWGLVLAPVVIACAILVMFPNVALYTLFVILCIVLSFLYKIRKSHPGRCDPDLQIALQPPPNVTTIFYPGNGSDHHQVAFYTGLSGYHGTIAQGAPVLIYNPLVVYPNEAIVSPEGLVDLFWWVIEWPIDRFTWIAARVKSMKYVAKNPFKLVIGQNADVSNLRNTYSGETTGPVILWGVSGGAVTTLVGFCQAMRVMPQVKLVVLEGCFDSVETIVHHRFGIFAKPVLWILSTFCEYDPDQRTPVDWARDFPRNIPVAFITSNRDQIVPRKHTNRVIEAVVLSRDGDRSGIHVLVLEHSDHSGYPIQHPEDQKRYYEFINSLYRKYNL